MKESQEEQMQAKYSEEDLDGGRIVAWNWFVLLTYSSYQ